MKAILAAIERLSKTHAEHISQYGTGAPPPCFHLILRAFLYILPRELLTCYSSRGYASCGKKRTWAGNLPCMGCSRLEQQIK